MLSLLMGKGDGLAAEVVETQGKGGATPGKGSVLATKGQWNHRPKAVAHGLSMSPTASE